MPRVHGRAEAIGPAAKTVTHLVIRPGTMRRTNGWCPSASANEGAGEIRLHSLAEFGSLDPAEDIEVVEGLDYGGGYGPDAVTGYGSAGSMGGWVRRPPDGASAWARAITGRVRQRPGR